IFLKANVITVRKGGLVLRFGKRNFVNRLVNSVTRGCTANARPGGAFFLMRNAGGTPVIAAIPQESGTSADGLSECCNGFAEAYGEGRTDAANRSTRFLSPPTLSVEGGENAPSRCNIRRRIFPETQRRAPSAC